jgi:UDP-apiose/xylose synthase
VNQTFNVGKRYNEVRMKELAELMQEAYADCTGEAAHLNHRIANVSGMEFYGEGYEDCDRRMPNLTKAKGLLGWEPTRSLRETLQETVTYCYEQYRNRPKAQRAPAVSQT